MTSTRYMFAEPKKPRVAYGSIRRAALLLLLDEHEGKRGMVMVGAGKDIEAAIARRLEADGLVILDAGEPGRWARLTPAGVIVAVKLRDMPKGSV